MRAQSVVMIAPPARDAADLLQTVEDLAIEQFITQAGIEALDIAVFPRATGLDVEGGDTEAAQPSAHCMGDELGAIIGPDMLGRPMLDEQIGQHVDDVVGSEPPQRYHRQAFPAELVDDVEHPELAAVVRLILDEVVGPHVPAMLRAQPHARSIAQPESTSLRLPLRYFKTLPPPDPFDHRQADLPASVAEQRMDAAIAVPTIILGQRDDVSRQTLLVAGILRTMSLRRTMLNQNTAGPPLRYRKYATDLLDRLAATRGA